MMHELSEEKHAKNVRFFAPRPARRRHPSTHRHAKISARGGPAGVLHARCGRDACRHACEGEAKVLQLDAARRLLVRDVRQHGQSGPSALPQLGSCASSGHAWPARYFERSILWAPSHRLGCSSQPPPKPPIPPPLTIQVRRVLPRARRRGITASTASATLAPSAPPRRSPPRSGRTRAP